jgi:hypothetical protein
MKEKGFGPNFEALVSADISQNTRKFLGIIVLKMQILHQRSGRRSTMEKHFAAVRAKRPGFQTFPPRV